MQASRIASSSCCRTCTDKTVQWRLNKMYRHHWASIDKKSRPATYLVELALWDAVSVVDDARWFKACGFVELDQQLSHHGGQILNDVLTVLLHPHRGTVSTWVGIHTANNLNIILKKKFKLAFLLLFRGSLGSEMLKALETFEVIWCVIWCGLKNLQDVNWSHVWY